MKTISTLGKRMGMSLSILMLLNLAAFSQQTLTTINGWNAYVHLPDDYNLTGTKRYPTIVFFPGTGEVGTNPALLLVYGPGNFIASGWNGYVTVNGVTEKPIIISLQPPALYPQPALVDQRIETIKSLYRVDTTRLSLTGLSMGGWTSEMYVENSLPFAKKIASVVALQAVRPDDNPAYPAPFTTYAKNCGHWLGYEQIYDNRDMLTIYNTMNAATPGSATYFQTNVGGGGHCCWNTWYNPAHTDNYSINGVTGNYNIYQYLLSWNSCNAATDLPPVANAGNDTTIMITDTAHLNGTHSTDPDGTISTYSWTKVAGPASLNLINSTTPTPVAANLSNGLYSFELAVTDNMGMVSKDTVNVLSTFSILPISYVYFTGKNNLGVNQLLWETANELGSGRYEIQRSSDSKVFNTIGTVAEQRLDGNSHLYSFNDKNASGVSYYRLHHIEATGKQTNSEVVVIKNGQPGISFSLYPNPVKDVAALHILSPDMGTAALTISGMDGRIVLKQQWFKSTEDFLQTVNISRLPAGQYIINLAIANRLLESGKIVKQ